MNDPKPSAAETPHLDPGQRESLLFSSLVLQQTNLALMFLGKAPHPETGQITRELEAAQTCIDLLEMLAVKTKGNLEKREHELLQQSLTNLRLMFVEAVEAGPLPVPEAPAPASASTEPGPPPAPTASAPDADTAASDDSRKKFVKRY